jgi:hypothetical protein
MQEYSQTQHVLVRFSDKWAPPEGTIAAHQKVFTTHGHVWVAEFGRGIGQSRITTIQNQIESGTPTYLALLASAGHQVSSQTAVGAAFLIDRVQPGKPDNGDYGIPNYYSHFPLPSVTWFRATTCIPLQRELVEGMRVPRSATSAMMTLKLSMAGAFHLRISNAVLDQLGHISAAFNEDGAEPENSS